MQFIRNIVSVLLRRIVVIGCIFSKYIVILWRRVVKISIIVYNSIKIEMKNAWRAKISITITYSISAALSIYGCQYNNMGGVDRVFVERERIFYHHIYCLPRNCYAAGIEGVGDVMFMRLGDDLYWAYGSTEYLEKRDQTGKVLAKNLFADANLTAALNSAIDVVAFGVASKDGDQKIEEETRAQPRAEALINFAFQAKDASTWPQNGAAYTVNLGKYLGKQDEFKKRPAFVVLVVRKEDGIDMMSEAVQRKLILFSASVQPLGVDISNFSLVRSGAAKLRHFVPTSPAR